MIRLIQTFNLVRLTCKRCCCFWGKSGKAWWETLGWQRFTGWERIMKWEAVRHTGKLDWDAETPRRWRWSRNPRCTWKPWNKHKHLFAFFIVFANSHPFYMKHMFFTIAKHVPAIWWHWHFLELPRHSLDASSTMGSPRSKFLELPRRLLDVSSNTSAPHEAAFNTFSSCWWK